MKYLPSFSTFVLPRMEKTIFLKVFPSELFRPKSSVINFDFVLRPLHPMLKQYATASLFPRSGRGAPPGEWAPGRRTGFAARTFLHAFSRVGVRELV